MSMSKQISLSGSGPQYRILSIQTSNSVLYELLLFSDVTTAVCDCL
jgi:hypothetical protein